MITQLRKGKQQGININPFILTGDLYPLINNGHDSFIEDRTAVPEIKTYTSPVRVAKKKKAVKKTNDKNTPSLYEEVYYMESDYETIVDERLEFSYQGMKFKVVKREPLARTDIIGYQYELDDITQGLTV